jgi:arginine decarboxylase-like protein
MYCTAASVVVDSKGVVDVVEVETKDVVVVLLEPVEVDAPELVVELLEEASRLVL